MAGKKPAVEAAKYEIEELKQQSLLLFQVQPEVIQGALHGLPSVAALTVDEVKDLIDQFLNRKVN